MSMHLTIPPMWKSWYKTSGQRRVRRCKGCRQPRLESLDDEESWMKSGRQALDHKIDCALEQVAAVKTNGPEEAR